MTFYSTEATELTQHMAEGGIIDSGVYDIITQQVKKPFKLRRPYEKKSPCHEETTPVTQIYDQAQHSKATRSKLIWWS